MCDTCTDVLELLESCDDISSVDEIEPMQKQHVFIFHLYAQTWAQRQCMCCFRDVRNYKRFNILVHSLLLTVLSVLKKFLENQNESSAEIANIVITFKEKNKSDDNDANKGDSWNTAEQEKLLQFVSKVFELSFPLYVAYKHSVHSKIEEISQDESGKLNTFCDVNDPEIPVYLLRNVCFFCEKDGVRLMSACFHSATSENLPINIAHGLVSIMSNLKLWMNINTIVKFLVLFRKNVIKYMCSFCDKDFRNIGSRNMSEFMWTIVKDPLDAHLSFDNDGLDLAFKYFTSTTLTMRLAGIAQINNHINMYNELCNNDNFLEADSIGSDLSSWLIHNKVVEHIFGPNLHVEIIKQSHIILNFLAMESKITNEQIDCIWSAAQLKHCSRQVHDLLPSLIKNMDTQPVLYLYNLLTKLDPQSHNEQTLFLASALIKFIWSNGNSPHPPSRSNAHVLGMSDRSCDLQPFPALLNSGITKHDVSSSENSISIEASEDEQLPQSIQNKCEIELNKCGGSKQSNFGDRDDDDGSEDESDAQSDRSVSQDERIIVDVENSQSDEDKRQELLISKTEDVSKSGDLSPVKNLNASGNSSVNTSNEGNSEDDEKELSRKISKNRRRKKRMPKQGEQVKVRIVEVNDGTVQVKDRICKEDCKSKGNLSECLCNETDENSNQETSRTSDNMEVSIYDCRPYLSHVNDSHLNLESPDNVRSCTSSKMSNKSEKNMADFEGEEDDSGCDDELVKFAAQAHLGSHHMQQHLANMASSVYNLHGKLGHQRILHRESNYHFDIESVCKPGHTLLWDLLQDEKITLLAQNVAIEAERVLCNLVCWANDRNIRMKFVEGCLHNLASNRSVVISLRLLPKLFSSFQQYRGCVDMHSITLWAEEELEMMKHFFNNLVTYTKKHNEANASSCPLYSHLIETQVRLQFLTCIFSTMGSPDNFRLSLEQIDKLWTSLANDMECSDELFSWLLNQAKNKDQHAIGLETFKHIFIEKMPLLKPENFSMTTLNLFQQLSDLARLVEISNSSNFSNAEVCGINQLWGIALRANKTEVSMAAIQVLNNYYISADRGTLLKEEECIDLCMESLSSAMANITEEEELNLVIIQRGLLLLRTHLEAFRKRYAYHLRYWQLKGEGVFSHRLERKSNSIRIVCQPAGLNDKITIVLSNVDYIADLRAEVTVWWERLQEQNRSTTSADGVLASVVTPILGSMLSGGPIRMISQGQELTTDNDERTLEEAGFKDLQLVFVSVGAPRPHRKRDGLEPASLLPAPQKDKVPMNLLLQPSNFEQLFNLMHQLSTLKTLNKHEEPIPHTKAQVLSRRVWDTLMMLPTSSNLLIEFLDLTKNRDHKGTKNFNQVLQKLINPENSQKLLYSLQIIESLSKKQQPSNSELSPSNAKNAIHSHVWSEDFIEIGGLRHLYDIFSSGVLQTGEGHDWDEWNQDCLEYMLKIMYELGVESSQVDLCQDDVSIENYEIPKKKSKHSKKSSQDKLLIPVFNQKMLEIMNIDTGMKALMSILYDASLPCDPNQYKTGFWSRAQVVHNTFSLLISWFFSNDHIKTAFFSSENFTECLKKLILDHPEPSVRREACTALHKLCLGTTIDGHNGRSCIAPLLSQLLSSMAAAQSMRPPNFESEETDKEPYGPSCKDYFWLVWHLVDNLDEDFKNEMHDQKSLLNLDTLTRYVAQDILKREYHESRHNTVPDDGLIGLLTLCTVLMKRNVPFKFSKEGQEFLLDIYDCIFALPCPEKRYLPKCKSQAARSWAYDLVVELIRGCFDNYQVLHQKLLHQHSAKSHAPYPWDYWPHEDERSECGYVGLTNLGATCYMASCMQHLYMIPQARGTILSTKCDKNSQYEATLMELQRMFAYLLESERKAYNPKSFCKVYTMDHQPLNTGEQKDMAEFFTDLISKLEDMTPHLKNLVKNLFCGVTTNNVVSLDCPHISRTIEEFYTVRCQVIDVRNLYESLNETTVKDTLEGDNMYTCSQCGKKVRAEKRACFKKLPKILCFNTMRYTFDMRTMSKEKVNTHFSFPLRLDMSCYMEKHLMPDAYSEENEVDISYEYDLIGVTVHTGTADGGHYYSFIRDSSGKDKWFSFNDAEVKHFDPARIATECFGGEMTVRSETYDSVSDKFMDFSLEKTNSAYMLFYERVPPEQASSSKDVESQSEVTSHVDNSLPHSKVDLTSELAEWIWKDNMQFLQDKSVFEHTYFNFMWQICGVIPQNLATHPELTLMSAKLSTSFVLETLIHAKEKPTMVQWIELLTKQFNASQTACEWFMEHMSQNDWWPVQILIKCPNQMVRQMFQRLCIHVINKLKPLRSNVYLENYNSDDSSDVDISQIEHYSCVTNFVKKLLTLIDYGAKQHLKHLTEYFSFLYEFAKMGDEECKFLLSTNAISIMINFYLGQKNSELAEVVSEEDDEEDDVISVSEDKYKPASLEKMIALIAMLVEKSRGEDRQLHLSPNDLNTIAAGKGFPFLFQQIKDNINVRQTCNLVFSLSRWNERMAMHIVNMIFTAITKHNESSQPFFKLLSMLAEFLGGPPGMPPFTNLILQRIWEIADFCPQPALEWLSIQVPRNKMAHSWVLRSMETWVEHFLIANSLQRVRNAAAFLLVSLVPSPHFRQAFRTARSVLSPHKEIPMNAESLIVLHQIYDVLLRLLKRAKLYVDATAHGTSKLVSYFALLTYCLVSRTEKLMFVQYFLDLWQLFQPKLSEPPIAVHHNKQALLIFWYNICVDCPENVKLVVQNAHVTKNIAFNYILADHDQQDVIIFNRFMLPAYYGLLRLCCQQSRPFTRQLANHQNIQWAFKHITPYTTQYGAAVDELFKLMKLFVVKYPDSSEQEIKEILTFKQATLTLYIDVLDPRSCWTTLISVFQILMETNEDRLYVILNNGLSLMFESFHMLHMMYHEATACHITGELVELLILILDALKCARMYRENPEVRQWLIQWKELNDYIRKLLTLLNSYTTNDVRKTCIDVLKEIVLLYPVDSLQTIVPLLSQSHSSFHSNNCRVAIGPYYPHRGQKSVNIKSSIRPQRPLLQMILHPTQLEASKGVDEEYDQGLREFFFPYHQFVDMLCRVAINYDSMTEVLVNLSVMIGCEAVPLHLALFPKLWLDIHNSEQVDRNYLRMLYNSNYITEYMEMVLMDEKLSLTNPIIYNFMSTFLPKVSEKVLNDQTSTLIESLVAGIINKCKEADLNVVVYRIISDLRVLSLLFMIQPPDKTNKELETHLLNLTKRASVLYNFECDNSSAKTESSNKKEESSSSNQPTSSSEKSSEITTSKESPQSKESSKSSSSSNSNAGSSCLSHPLWVEVLSKTVSEFLNHLGKS